MMTAIESVVGRGLVTSTWFDIVSGTRRSGKFRLVVRELVGLEEVPGGQG